MTVLTFIRPVWKLVLYIVFCISGDNKYAVIHNGCMYVYSDVQAKKPTVAISLYGYNK